MFHNFQVIPINEVSKNLNENKNSHPTENENDFTIKQFNSTSKASFGKIKKMNSMMPDARISYDSGDFRKKFDLFIKNINEQTKNNLMDPKRRRSEGLNIASPKSNSVKPNHKNN